MDKHVFIMYGSHHMLTLDANFHNLKMLQVDYHLTKD